jgi:hypothetical protein
MNRYTCPDCTEDRECPTHRFYHWLSFWVIVVACIGIVLFLCGCMNVERLSRQLSENNAAFTLKINKRLGTVEISRTQPQLGYWSQAGDVSVRVPTNVTMSVQHLVLPAGVTNISAVNPQQKGKP